MRRLICFAALVSLLFPGITSLATGGNPQCQGSGRSPPDEPREGSVVNSYGGTVTELTKDSITIQWANTPGEKPKKFAVSETLAAGKVPIERRLPAGQEHIRANPMMPEYMYRLTDVKVGDCIAIFYARINGVDLCDHIRIWRRPDGLVPPLPKEAEDLRRGKNLRELFKSKYPDKPLPDWMDKLPKNDYVPYHDWQNAYWARQAPMPREVKLTTPNISP